jgi:thiamine-monophosphate kinase
MNKESQLLARISATVPTARVAKGTGVRLGIGDDAALIAPKRYCEVVVSSDFFIEDTHFLAGVHPAESVGYKSLARAVSDLAAMGAEPGYFLLNLAMPAERTWAWLDGYLKGLSRAARSCRILLIGGDLARTRRIDICITVIGYVKTGMAVRRSGARAGDLVYVSGNLGAARLGLEIAWKRLQQAPGAKRFLRAHLYPEIRLELGAWLARNRIATAMMDISDGLSIDLERVCEASRAGARIEVARIPRAKIPPDWKTRLRLRESAELDYALHGGDDYELLFTVPPQRAHKLRGAPDGVTLTRIGEITRDRRILIVDKSGKTEPLPAGGWDHFARLG